ncbi:hypothetical protein F4861DRAFT_253750 [Xylaria intraflava]|nr:hypothetical protein F4861DRAFT_253750 [Xylaria intraflava]
MASSTYFSSDPYRRHSAQTLKHKVSNLSESSDLSSPLHGRESLVSLQSSYESPTLPPKDFAPAQQWYRGPSLNSFRENSSGRYQPAPSPPLSSGRFRSFRARMQDTILEDENINMSLLGTAAQPNHSSPYSAVPEEESDEPIFDMTSFSGPMGAQDQEFLRSLQEQEVNGRLTGDPGQGEVPSTVITGEQLISATPSRTWDLEQPVSTDRAPTLTPKKSWKSPRQEEATRRETIKMVMGEPAHTDPCSITSPQTVSRDRQHVVSMPHKKQVLYARPNWKPFFMRWPYLLFLILVSIVLGIAQELLYQMSTRPGELFRFTSAQDFDPRPYSIFKFIPTVITVTYGILWQITDSEVKRLEVFYQMSKKGGALAPESINADYITSFSFMRLFLVSYKDHYTVVVSSVATFLAISLVPILGAAAFILTPDRAIESPNPNEIKAITVSAVASRLLTIAFFLIAILGCVLLYQVTTRRSGLVADVRGIAGLASMAVGSNIMRDFKDMDTAKPKQIRRRLKNRRYELRNSSIFSEELTPTSIHKADTYKDTRLSENPHPLMLRNEGCVPFVIGLLLFFVLLVVFLFTPASVVIRNAPWVVTVLTVCIKLAWGRLETSIRVLEQYYILAKRHAPAKTLILDYTAMPFAVVAIRGLFNRHWIIFLICLGTVLVEVLTILATSLAQIGGKDFLNLVDVNDSTLSQELESGSAAAVTFVATLVLTGLILLYLCVAVIVVLVHRRRPFLPRQPNTIASVLAFMHQSKMPYRFSGACEFTKAQMREKIDELDELGKTYGMGWFSGRDALTHYGIDEEELMANYKQGRKRDQDETVS